MAEFFRRRLAWVRWGSFPRIVAVVAVLGAVPAGRAAAIRPGPLVGPNMVLRRATSEKDRAFFRFDTEGVRGSPVVRTERVNGRSGPRAVVKSLSPAATGNAGSAGVQSWVVVFEDLQMGLPFEVQVTARVDRPAKGEAREVQLRIPGVVAGEVWVVEVPARWTYREFPKEVRDRLLAQLTRKDVVIREAALDSMDGSGNPVVRGAWDDVAPTVWLGPGAVGNFLPLVAAHMLERMERPDRDGGVVAVGFITVPARFGTPLISAVGSGGVGRDGGDRLGADALFSKTRGVQASLEILDDLSVDEFRKRALDRKLAGQGPGVPPEPSDKVLEPPGIIPGPLRGFPFEDVCGAIRVGHAGP